MKKEGGEEGEGTYPFYEVEFHVSTGVQPHFVQEM